MRPVLIDYMRLTFVCSSVNIRPMLKIRLQRVGRKNDASYRVVVIESQRGPKAGNALEVLGSYDPKKDSIEINGERVTHWINVGAQTSPTVHNLLIKKKIIEGGKINVLPKKSPIKKEGTSDDKKEKTETTVEKVEGVAAETKKEEPKEETKDVEKATEEIKKNTEEKKIDESK